MAQPAKHAADHGPNGPDPMPSGAYLWEIKVFHDLQTVTVGDNKHVFKIPEAFQDMRLLSAEAFVSTVSTSGKPTVQMRKLPANVDMLTTPITIDSGFKHSYFAAVRSVVDASIDVDVNDLVAIDVDVAGTGAKGLGVIVTFG